MSSKSGGIAFQAEKKKHVQRPRGRQSLGRGGMVRTWSARGAEDEVGGGWARSGRVCEP